MDVQTVAVTANSPLYAASFNFAAVLVGLTCLLYVWLLHRFDKMQNKLFHAIVINIVLTAASDAAAELIRTFAGTGPAALTAIEVVGMIYFITHTLQGPLFLMYVLTVCRSTVRRRIVRNGLLALPFYIVELLILTNPLTHWVYSYASDLSFSRGWAMIVVYLVGVLYLVMGFAVLIRRWRALTPTRRLALGFLFAMVFAGVLVQLLVPAIRIELFAESLGILGIMVFVENEDDLMDFESGVYNRHALGMDLAMHGNPNDPYHVIAVRITDIDLYAHVGGASQLSKFVSEEIAGYLKSVMPWYYVYRTASTRFVLVNPKLNLAETREVAEKIAERFKHSWEYLDVNVDLHAVVVLASMPDDLPTADEVFYLVDTPVPSVAGKDVLQGKDLSYLMRRADVERAVRRGLDEGNYEVYYQPIYNKRGVVCSVEALMRLHDKALGDVPPVEFIEVAERIGFIEEIGEFALHEVCAFLASGVPQNLGIGRIGVNLSVVQCMQAGFAHRADSIIAAYGVDPGSVTFEITESVAAGDYGFLGRVMGTLKRSGHRFAMDDYGTGYSNMHSLVSLDFDVVKIDKSMLWDAEKSATGRAILRNGIGMMCDIGCEVLVEGVETAAQVEMLHALGVDYYQGFYYAKPMPKDALIEFLSTR